MNAVNFNVAKKDFETISSIADRAVYVASKAGDHLDRTEIEMDLCAAHNTCPLKLDELLAADDFNFAHDVTNIGGMNVIGASDEQLTIKEPGR